MRLGRSTLAIVAALIVSTGGRVALAGEKKLPEVELRYDVAAPVNGCPTAQELVAEVERELGADPFRASAPLRVSVAIEAHGRQRLSGRVVFSGVASDASDLPWGGHETFRASDCNELTRTIALVITLAVERLQSARARQVEQQPSSERKDVAESVAPLPAGIEAATASLPPNVRAASGTRSSSSQAARRVRVETFAGVVAATDLTPRSAVGASFGAGVRLGPASLGLEAILLAPSTASSGRGGGVSVSMKALAIAACWHLPLPPGAGVGLEVRACPVVAPLLLRGVGESLALARAGDVASIALGGRVGAGMDVLAPIRLEVGLDALAPLTRHVFAIDDEEVWVQPAIGFAAHADLAVRFW
ncbi:MAG: hypothetical protein K0S65_84 [Labilithrix sp.]|nr:hypothetical protein [Labilithrix sp.]